MKFSLVVVSGSTSGKEIPIRMPEFVIGRDPECHLRPASAMISKKHCAFTIQGEQLLFKDFGSTNGSFVNEVRVEKETYLRDGDIVKFGPLTFSVKLQPTGVMAAMPSVASGNSTTVVEKAPSRTSTSTTSSTSQTVKKATAAEDDIAAMLFNFADAPSGSVNPNDIPMGSTVAGMTIDPTTVEEVPALNEEQKRIEDQKKAMAARKAANSASTSNAAQAILEKYMKRPRA